MRDKKCDLFPILSYTLSRSINVVYFARLSRLFCTIFPFILHDFPCPAARILRRFLRALHPILAHIVPQLLRPHAQQARRAMLSINPPLGRPQRRLNLLLFGLDDLGLLGLPIPTNLYLNRRNGWSRRRGSKAPA